MTVGREMQIAVETLPSLSSRQLVCFADCKKIDAATSHVIFSSLPANTRGLFFSDRHWQALETGIVTDLLHYLPSSVTCMEFT